MLLSIGRSPGQISDAALREQLYPYSTLDEGLKSRIHVYNYATGLLANTTEIGSYDPTRYYFMGSCSTLGNYGGARIYSNDSTVEWYASNAGYTRNSDRIQGSQTILVAPGGLRGYLGSTYVSGRACQCYISITREDLLTLIKLYNILP